MVMKGSRSTTLKRKVDGFPPTTIKKTKIAVPESDSTKFTSLYEIAPANLLHISSRQSKVRLVHAQRKGQRSFGNPTNQKTKAILGVGGLNDPIGSAHDVTDIHGMCEGKSKLSGYNSVQALSIALFKCIIVVY
ncbi:unnamed protein product [Lactuca virosa]|uniref:Uncharacterized protein n=1 Tax=Lactuca virosa TaxID=75947 RepID=A0AAU9NR76_9ASTR|nr:unnamed protein product [Lactuca virosa]